ncbi:MAG: DUF4159 domain-containing protein [Alphaproteobacteria bacterium]|nr:DUF4159 domain-containing protein [Alphaproteobacteria bacterium]MCW5741784.1 DUF4159 domain-containing protein [Alphaproteobacteria bacterium]
MLALGTLAFATPWMLALLLSLPVIYFLLRLMPPAPKLIRFPAIRLLLGLEPEEQTPVRLPWWLLLLRLLLVTLLILALARPLLNPQSDLPGSGPLVLAIDDGWAAAPNWSIMQRHAERLTERAERAKRPVVILTTAPAALDEAQPQRGLLRPDEARAVLRALKPKPWPVDRAVAANEIGRVTIPRPAHVVWLSDGLEAPDTARYGERLAALGTLEVVMPAGPRAPMVLVPPAMAGRELRIEARRPSGDGPRRIAVQGVDDRGALLARGFIDFAPTATEATGTLNVPTEIRNRIIRLDIEGNTSAGATALLDERYRRRPVGILGERQTASGQPLLQEVFFLERALEPYAQLTIGDAATILNRQTAILLVPDGASPGPAERDNVVEWMMKGGVVVRFAGPRLASASDDDLVPVKLRLGDRALGGVMSWGSPASIAEFAPGSPFYGLRVPEDARITQQVLAEPGPDVSDKTWARLADGTPLVTAEKRGEGWLVLIHTTANTSWSNIAISGLFVDMLQRLVALSRGVAGDAGGQTALKPWKTLDGFARLVQPPLGTLPLPLDAASTMVPRPQTPPGLYGDESSQVAFNLGNRVPAPAPIASLPSGATTDTLTEAGETDLTRWFLTVALCLLLLDLLISLWLRGMLPSARGLRRRATPAVLLPAALAIGLAAVPDRTAQAASELDELLLVQSMPGPGRQPPPRSTRDAAADPADEMVLRATLETRLAYIVTGNAEVDNISRAGLEGLGEILRARTSVEPGEPIAVDVEKDELRLFPLLYWPVTQEQATPSPKAMAAIDRHLKTGGIIFFDTRDQHITLGRGGLNNDLKRLLRGIDVPPLVAMPHEHVLTKAFYLLSDTPGRWSGGRLWIEAGGGRINDGVATIIIGANDFAGAWAVDRAGRGTLPVAPGGEAQRELAFRFGVNLVMYALTGNYKDDSVHMNDIMQRLRR